jgi:hypothetical protein
VSGLDLLDWRRRTADLYREVRRFEDPQRGFDHWCKARGAMFASHPASADHDARLRYADYDPAMRFDVALTDADPERIDIPTATDGVVSFHRIGRVDLTGVGTLDVWWLGSYGGGVWLPIRDAGADTYGGGRYVIDTVKGADLGGRDDRLVVDLNFAYNPSCAYDEKWACPLAPPGNVVTAEVTAGELVPG